MSAKCLNAKSGVPSYQDTDQYKIAETLHKIMAGYYKEEPFETPQFDPKHAIVEKEDNSDQILLNRLAKVFRRIN